MYNVDKIEHHSILNTMRCFASAISILIILFSLTIAKESVKLVGDDEFLAFVKDPSNFWQCKELEERNKVKYSIYGRTFGFKKMREQLMHKSEASLGVLYLMRQNWQCAKIVEQFNEKHKRECHKFRKYLDILFEYLFRVYVEGVDSMLAQPVKPNFKLQLGERIDDGTLFDVIGSLSDISKFFFNPAQSEWCDYNLKSLFRIYFEPKLLNEKEFELNDANSNGTFRQQFDAELKQMAKTTKKREQKEANELIKLSKMGRNRQWYEQWDKRRTANIDKFHGFRVSPFNDSIILFDDLDLLLALFHDPPTFYEILKMAKKLGEMGNDFHILLNSSDLKQISKRLNRPEEPIEKIEIQIENEFCALAFFVGDLLEAANIKNISNIELIGVTLLEMAKTEMVLKVELLKVDIENLISYKCKEMSEKKEIKKYIGDKDFYDGKTPKIDFNPINDLIQIVPEIIREIEQMLQKSDWNYANLKYLKMSEWILLKYDLYKMGNDQKWEQIEQLRGEWEKAFNDWYFKQNEENRPNFEEMMGNLIEMLSNIDFSGEGKINDSVVLRALKRAKIA